MVERKRVASGSPYEQTVGFSRAVRVGAHVAVAGTAPIWPGGEVDPDPLAQASRCWQIALEALGRLGGTPADVIRTRTYLTSTEHQAAAAQAHAEHFADIRPASTMLVVSALLDPRWVVEVELDAVLADTGASDGDADAGPADDASPRATDDESTRSGPPADHDRDHGRAREPGHDAAHWNERYAATDRLWSPEPNATVAEIVYPLEPGRALDLGTGEGRHAVWLAQRGWSVTAVDFAAVGVDRGRAGAGDLGVSVDWQVADVRAWSPAGSYELVLVAYLHLPDDVLSRAARWLAPGGRLVVVGHALRNLAEGVGGPSDPRLLHTEDQLRRAAAGLSIDRLGEVMRQTPAGAAIDVCLVARRGHD